MFPTNNNARFQTYKSRRDSLKEDFERRKLPRRLNVDGYFFSLHDLTRHKLAYVCCRKTSTKCKIKVMVTWDDLERVGYYKEDNIRVSMNLNGNIMYELKGFHSPACVAKYNYLARKALIKSLEEQKDRKKNKKKKPHEEGAIEKNVKMTLDGGKIFFLGETQVEVESRVHIILLLGSKFMIEQLVNCSCIFVNQTQVTLGFDEETWLISFLIMDSSGECIPTVHLLLDKTRRRLVREGFHMLLREIYTFFFNTPKNSKYNYLPRSKSGNIYEDLQINQRWKMMYCHDDRVISDEIRRVFRCDVMEGNFWLTIEMERERQRLKIPKSTKTRLVLSICQTLWVVEKSQREKVFRKLFSQVSQERERNLEALIYFFKALIEDRGNTGNGEEVIGFSKASGEMTKRFHESLKREMRRKNVTLEIVFNILRFYELEFRQNIINGKILLDESKREVEELVEEPVYGNFVNVEEGFREFPEENIDINIDINSQAAFFQNPFFNKFGRR